MNILEDTLFDNSTFWISDNGKRNRIKDMETKHIINTINMLNDNSRAYIILATELKKVCNPGAVDDLTVGQIKMLISNSKVHAALSDEYANRIPVLCDK